MLEIIVPSSEQYDEALNRFVYIKGGTIIFEHSLVSLSKWEAKWNKPFLAKVDHSREEILDYIKCMAIGKYDPIIFNGLTESNLNAINEYINAPMTATWFSEKNKNSSSRETVTSELIYYWMISYQIPFECQKWHLNRLLTLIRICSIKNAPPKKVGKNEMLRNRSALNAARKKQFGTHG